MFSKAERFKDSAPTAPPVGSYDIGGQDSNAGAVSFHKAARFKSDGSDCGDGSFADDSLIVPATPRVRRPSSHSSSDGRITPSHKSKISTKEQKKRSPTSPNPKVAELEKEIKKLYSERGELSKQLRISKEDITKLEGKLQAAVKDKLSLQAEVASLQKINMNLARGKDVLEARSLQYVDVGKTRVLQSQLDQKKRQLQFNSQQLQRVNSQMEASKRGLESSLTMEKETRAELEVRMAVVEDELYEVRDLKEKISSELSDLQGAHEQLEREHSQVKADLAEAQETCQSQGAELASTKEQLSSVLEEKRSLEEQLSTTTQEKYHLKEALEQAQQSIAETSRENSELRIQLQSLEEKVKTLTADNEGLERELTNTQVDLRATKTEFTQHQEESQQALESLTKKCLAFEEELSHQKKTSKENQAVLNAQISAMEISIKEQTQEYQATLKILEAKKSENTELESQLKWLKRESEEAKVASETHIKEVLSIAEDLKAKEAEQASAIEQLKSVNEKLQSDFTETTTQLKEKTEKATSLETELESLKPSAEKAADERANLMKQELGKKLMDTQKRLTAQEQQYEMVRSELLERVAELEAEVSRLRDENEQVTTAYEELEEKYRPFLEQVDSLEDLNKLLQSQTSLAQSEAEKFGELYAKVLGHQNQKQKIQYVKKLRDENASLKQEVIVMRNEITKLKKTIRKLQLEGGATAPAAATKKPLASKN